MISTQVIAVLLVDREDPLGEHRVHDVRRALGLDADDAVARRRDRHRADGRHARAVRVDRVELRQRVGHGLRRDVRAVAELVAVLERDLPDVVRDALDGLRHLADDFAVLVDREQFLGDAVARQGPARRA